MAESMRSRDADARRGRRKGARPDGERQIPWRAAIHGARLWVCRNVYQKHGILHGGRLNGGGGARG